MDIKINIRSGNKIETALEFSDTSDFSYPFSIQVNEVNFIQIAITGFDNTTAVSAGFLELQGFSREGEATAYFGRPDLSIEEFEKDNCFSTVFVNQVGRSRLIIEHQNNRYEIEVDIESTKVSEQELAEWLKKIDEEFPIFSFSDLLTPITQLAATKNKQNQFRSLLTFILESKKLVSKIADNLNLQGYLKRDFMLHQSIGGSELYKKSFVSQKWLKPGTKWKPAPLSNHSIVRKGLSSFEPEKYPTLRGEATYDNNMNQTLLFQLNTLAFFCIAAEQFVRLHPHQLEMLNTQFNRPTARLRLFWRYIDELSKLRLECEKLSSEIQKLGVSAMIRPQNLNFDNRYVQLLEDILKLENVNSQLLKYQTDGNFLLGTLGLELVFEVYSYACILDSLKKLGFTVVDVSEGQHVPHYIKLHKANSENYVRILYDQAIPRATENKINFPIWDFYLTKPNAPLYRPDFILHFHSFDYEETVVLDAKFKTTDRCEEDFNSFKPSQSLMVKYGTKMYSSGSSRAAPKYIGAMCCSDENTNSTRQIWITKSNSAIEPLPTSAGITSLFSADNLPLTNLLAILWDDFETNARALCGNRISGTGSIEVFQENANKVSKKYSKRSNDINALKMLKGSKRSYNLSDKAPTLTENDAKIIKGMLLRGDIPQHITQYFGVNPGRISDIKTGKTFADIEPEKQRNLPMAGPYPPIRELLEQFPEIGKAFHVGKKNNAIGND